MKMILLAASLTLAAGINSESVKVVDGDTIYINDEKIRLMGIDAPEMPGHCRKGRECAIGDPYASKSNLEKLAIARPIEITRFGLDRYGRTIALVSFGGIDLSCAQIKSGGAIYVEKWDNGRNLEKYCN